MTMSGQHPCKVFHRFEPAENCGMAPLFKKLSRPSRRTILLKLLKLFPQQVCFYRPQIHLQELIEFETLLFSQVFPAFQEAIGHICEYVEAE